MKFSTRFFILTALFTAFSANSYAFVDVNPRYYDFGNVRANTSRWITVIFTNQSADAIRSFQAYCSGDLSVYQCSSSCFQLQPWGTCSVQVQFNPRTGDSRRHTITVHGQGSGNYVSAQVYGVDADENRMARNQKRNFWAAYAASVLISPWKTHTP
jgi:hypothetical protein